MSTPASINVLIPSVFTSYTQGSHSHRVRADTVGQAIANLVEDFPPLKAQLLDEGGNLLNYVQLFVNENNIRDLDDLKTPLSDQDELLLVPALAGG